MAQQIISAGHPLRFEDHVIRYTQPETAHRYTPDFPFEKRDGTLMFIEGKGLFDAADRKKHLRIRALFPELDIRFVFSNAKQKISKASKTTYAKWCETKGFLYADKGVIPKEWLNE